MWIKINEEGKIVTRIPHGQIIRQGGSFQVTVAFDRDFFNPQLIEQQLDSDLMLDGELLGWLNENVWITASFQDKNGNSSRDKYPNFEFIRFNKVNSNENIGALQDNLLYLCFKYEGTPDQTIQFGEYKLIIRLSIGWEIDEKGNVISVGTTLVEGVIPIHVEKTYGKTPIVVDDVTKTQLDELFASFSYKLSAKADKMHGTFSNGIINDSYLENCSFQDGSLDNTVANNIRILGGTSSEQSIYKPEISNALIHGSEIHRTTLDNITINNATINGTIIANDITFSENSKLYYGSFYRAKILDASIHNTTATNFSIRGGNSVVDPIDDTSITNKKFVVSYVDDKYNQIIDGTIKGGNANKLNGHEASYYLNYNNFTNIPFIPTKVSDLVNDSQFINKEVNNLTNYVIKNETGTDLLVSIDNNTYIMTVELKNSSGQTISSGQVDLPLETMVINASYADGTLTLTLKNGQTVEVDISSLVSGLVPDTRKVNGKELKNDINLTANDVGAYTTQQVDAIKNDLIFNRLNQNPTNSPSVTVSTASKNIIMFNDNTKPTAWATYMIQLVFYSGTNIVTSSATMAFRDYTSDGYYISSPFMLHTDTGWRTCVLFTWADNRMSYEMRDVTDMNNSIEFSNLLIQFKELEKLN